MHLVKYMRPRFKQMAYYTELLDSYVCEEDGRSD